MPVEITKEISIPKKKRDSRSLRFKTLQQLEIRVMRKKDNHKWSISRITPEEGDILKDK